MTLTYSFVIPAYNESVRLRPTLDELLRYAREESWDTEILVVNDGSSDDTKILSLTPPNNEASSGDLQIRFVGLTPVPRQADGNAPRAYVAQLVVNRM